MSNRLELTWYGKDDPIKVEPRLLMHDASKDFGDADTENMLIHGDNLLALKALEKDYAGNIHSDKVQLQNYKLIETSPKYLLKWFDTIIGVMEGLEICVSNREQVSQ